MAIIPTFDIPSQYIVDNARQFRFNNETTTDDHGMLIVGYMGKDGVTWCLVKIQELEAGLVVKRKTQILNITSFMKIM